MSEAPDGGILLAAVEAGGTKFVCGVGDLAGGSRRTVRIATRDPASTLAEVVAFFSDALESGLSIGAIGVGSFGPLQLDRRADDFGRITATPKPGWQGVDIPARLRAALGVPVAIETDVNAAALAEARLRDARSLAYVTVGTGIGVGLVVEGATVRGLGHPEMGHIPIRRHALHGDFAGTCPFHGDCLEGLASGPAVIAAWGASFSGLPDNHPAWEVEADYLGQLCATLILTVAPEHIVLGGGVMNQHRLIAATRRATVARLAGYCPAWTREDDVERRIGPPASAEASGLVGAYLLAEEAAQSRRG